METFRPRATSRFPGVIVPFTPAPERRTAAPSGSARILLFTGVRYERRTDAATEGGSGLAEAPVQRRRL